MVLPAIFSIFLLGSDFIISNAADNQLYPAVAYENNQYYVFWTDYRSAPIYALYGARVSTTGSVLDNGGKVLVSDSIFNVRVSYDGSNFLAVWREGCWSNGDIRGVRVTPDCDANGSPFYISQAANIQWMPDVAFGGGNHLVVWADSRIQSKRYVIYAARVTPSGMLLDPNGIQVGISDIVNQYSPSVVYTDSKFFVAWGYVYAPYRVLGRFVQNDGSLSDTVRIASIGSSAYGVRAAYSGANILVTWVEYVSPSYQIRGQLVSSGGTLIGSPFIIAPSHSGQVTTPSPSQYSSLELCFDGWGYLASYSDLTIYTLWGRKIDTNGNPLGIPFRISNSGYNQYYFDVTPGAYDRYFSVWSELVGSAYDLKGNLDVVITGDIAEQNAPPIEHFELRSRIVRDAIVLENSQGKNVELFDIVGKKIGATKNGCFNCQQLEKGVYFIRVSTGEEYKVIKI